MSLWYTIRDSPFTSSSSAKTSDVPHGMTCSVFAFSQRVSIMLERSLHEHFADNVPWKNVKIGQATHPGLVALFCHSNLRMDKQEQHS